jgi:two-component system phosphate regulon sensor histidine kinase PhoR
MDRSRWFFHPILIFVVSIIALGTSLILYIYWYIEVSAGLKAMVDRFHLDAGQVLTAQTWVVILVLSILVGLILLGLFTIFAYSQKMVQLYRLQHNFINNFTHELKTPVASLSLYLETFKKHDLAREDLVKYIDYMLGDVSRLSDNISRILNLARIESRIFTGDFVWLDPLAVIERFLEKHQHLFSHCRVALNRYPGETMFCRLNPALFDILLMNLMTNAVNYNANGVPSVTIRARVGTARLHLLFQDNGIGFEKHERKKIFRKFYQIGSADDMTAKGSGIGLYLVQNIVKIHKGRISASSPGPGQGALFTLSLPIHKTQLQKPGRGKA